MLKIQHMKKEEKALKRFLNLLGVSPLFVVWVCDTYNLKRFLGMREGNEKFNVVETHLPLQ
jgi:glutaredoxin-related protein